jgi:hypothetical protein
VLLCHKTHDTRGYTLEDEGIKICSCPRDSKVITEDLMNPRQTGEMPYGHKTSLSYATPFVASGWRVIAVLFPNTGIITATSAFAGWCLAGPVLFWHRKYILLKVHSMSVFILLYALIIFSVLSSVPTTLMVLLLPAACAIIFDDRLNVIGGSSEKLKEDLKKWTDFCQSMSTV